MILAGDTDGINTRLVFFEVEGKSLRDFQTIS